MHLTEILIESFRLLRREPKIYLPRIFTTVLYTVFLLYTASFSLRITRAINLEVLRAQMMRGVPDLGRALSQFWGQIVFFLLFFLVVYAVDILSYGMYATIVRDYHSKNKVNLTNSLNEALKKTKTLFLLGLVILAFIGAFLVVYAFMSTAFIVTQNPAFLVLALLVLLTVFIGFAVLFFFSVPVAVLEDVKLAVAMRKSMDLGIRNKGIVLKTNFLFAGLMLVTLGVAMFADFKGKIGLAAVTAFIVGRLLQALVYTYISVVNPVAYLKLEEDAA
jgi:FtsH-binding integral membrane protein